MNLAEIDKIAQNPDRLKSAVQALQLEAIAIHDLETVIKAFQPGQTLNVQSYAALGAAVRDLSETNTALQEAVMTVPKLVPAAPHEVPTKHFDRTSKAGIREEDRLIDPKEKS